MFKTHTSRSDQLCLIPLKSHLLPYCSMNIAKTPERRKNKSKSVFHINAISIIFNVQMRKGNSREVIFVKYWAIHWEGSSMFRFISMHLYSSILVLCHSNPSKNPNMTNCFRSTLALTTTCGYSASSHNHGNDSAITPSKWQQLKTSLVTLQNIYHAPLSAIRIRFLTLHRSRPSPWRFPAVCGDTFVCLAWRRPCYHLVQQLLPAKTQPGKWAINILKETESRGEGWEG